MGFLEDSQKAVYRIAGAQTLKASKIALIARLRKYGIGKKNLEKLAGFIDTDVGNALFSSIFGVALSCYPPLRKDKKIKYMANEFRVNGISFLYEKAKFWYSNNFSNINKRTKKSKQNNL